MDTPSDEQVAIEADHRLLAQIHYLMNQLPGDLMLGQDNLDGPIVLNSHLVCDALAQLMPEQLRSVVGVLLPQGTFHAWLVTRPGNIIEVGYIRQPLLLKKGSEEIPRYQKNNAVKELKRFFAPPAYWRAVRTITYELRVARDNARAQGIDI